MDIDTSQAKVVTLPVDNHQDPLRQGLLLLCRQLGRPLGDAELVDGIALEQGQLPLNKVVRALRRADIVAQVVEQPLRQMDDYLLPALLLLNNGQTVLLVGVEDEHARVLVPQSNGGAERMALAELEALYSGRVVFAKCRFRPDGRIGDYAKRRVSTGSSARCDGCGVPTPRWRSPLSRPTCWRSPRRCSPCRYTTGWSPTAPSTPCGSWPVA